MASMLDFLLPGHLFCLFILFIFCFLDSFTYLHGMARHRGPCIEHDDDIFVKNTRKIVLLEKGFKRHAWYVKKVTN